MKKIILSMALLGCVLISADTCFGQTGTTIITLPEDDDGRFINGAWVWFELPEKVSKKQASMFHRGSMISINGQSYKERGQNE